MSRVLELTARSLRRIAGQPERWKEFTGWPKDMPLAEQSAVAVEMLALASELEERMRPATEGDPSEPGHPDNPRSTM